MHRTVAKKPDLIRVVLLVKREEHCSTGVKWFLAVCSVVPVAIIRALPQIVATRETPLTAGYLWQGKLTSGKGRRLDEIGWQGMESPWTGAYAPRTLEAV